MSNESEPKSSSDVAIQASNEPLTMKDRIIGILLMLAFAAAGVAMWLWPGFLSLGDDRATGRRGRVFAFLLEVVWSRPVGAVLLFLAALMLWGTLTKRSPSAARQ